jgi:hypothetical protein
MLEPQECPRIRAALRHTASVVARLESGGILEDLPIDDELSLPVRFERCPVGWQASFSLSHPAVGDLAVTHRLVAPSLAEARAAVAPAVTYLLGTPVDEVTATD